MIDCNSACEGLSKDNNKYDLLISQLLNEVKDLCKTSTAKFLFYDEKVAELCAYIKENLTNSIRCLINDMQLSGEIDKLITDSVMLAYKELEIDVHELKNKTVGIVTPEMFGAIGDGVCDDTKALQKAFETGKTIIGTKKYLISEPVYIVNDYTDISITGEIISKGEGIIIINACYCNIVISKISGNHGIKLYRDDKIPDILITAYNIINLNSVIVNNTALSLYANGHAGIQYNQITFGLLYGKTAIELECGNDDMPWINQNAFFGGRIRGIDGIKTKKGKNQTDKFNGNSFNNMGFESISNIAIKLDFSTRNIFLNCRMGGEGEFGGEYWVYLTNSTGNLFDSPCMEMRLSRIYDDNDINVNFPSYNIFKGYLFLYDLDSYAGRTVISYNGKYYIDDVLKNVSISSYGKNHDFANDKFLHNDFYISIGADNGQNIKHIFTECFGKLIKSFFIECSYINNNTSSITFTDVNGVEQINSVFESDKIYRAMFTPSGWVITECKK